MLETMQDVIELATAPDARERLVRRFMRVRGRTVGLVAPLTPEDQMIQSMPDVSPSKWHLAHTTWFFETFVLAQFVPDYRPVHPLYRTLFNSYYEAVGARHPRAERGLLSRPTVREVLDYRRHVDARIHRSGVTRPCLHTLSNSAAKSAPWKCCSSWKAMRCPRG